MTHYIGLSDVERNNIKARVHAAVRLAGGQENARNVTSRVKRAASFSDYGNAAQPDRHIPVDLAVEIDLFNGEPIIIRFLAEQLGYGLVRLPSPEVRGSVMGALGRSVKEAAEAISALTDVTVDGPLPNSDTIERAIKEGEESVIATLEVIARLKAMRDEHS